MREVLDVLRRSDVHPFTLRRILRAANALIPDPDVLTIDEVGERERASEACQGEMALQREWVARFAGS